MNYNKFILPLLTLVLVACGPDSKHIQLNGQLLNLNQGEFLVYSPDGATEGVDTLFVEGGRFDFETECSREGSVIISMPNGQEVPVFVRPGKSYKINGDAQKLRDVKVDGGDDNKLMNEFRKSVIDVPASQSLLPQVKSFVAKHPASPVSLYLVRKHVVCAATPDYSAAYSLMQTIQKASPDNTALLIMLSQMEEISNASKGKPLPSFNFTDINGRTITSTEMKSGTWMFCSFASWDFESISQIRRLNSIKRDKKADWHIVGISFDSSKGQIRLMMTNTLQDVTVICDETMTETPLAKKLAMYQTGVVVIAKDGKITERDLYDEPLFDILR